MNDSRVGDTRYNVALVVHIDVSGVAVASNDKLIQRGQDFVLIISGTHGVCVPTVGRVAGL
jgi:hypothetical protein